MADTPVLDLLASMTADSIEASSLDPETLMLVRIAALVAVDAAPIVVRRSTSRLPATSSSTRIRFAACSPQSLRSSGRHASSRRSARSSKRSSSSSRPQRSRRRPTKKHEPEEAGGGRRFPAPLPARRHNARRQNRRRRRR